MNRWKHFECCVCHEPFTYEPSKQTEKNISEMELRSGRPFDIIVGCPHCPAYLRLNTHIGKVENVLETFRSSSGVCWDMTLTEKDNERVQSLNEEGDNLMQQGNVIAALEKFKEAIRIRKHDPISWYNLGVCKNRMGQKNEAIEAFRHAIKYDTDFENAWSNLGMLLVEIGKVDEGSECFDKAISIKPDYPKPYLGKGNVNLLQGNIDQARYYYKLALKKDRNYKPAQIMLRQIQ